MVSKIRTMAKKYLRKNIPGLIDVGCVIHGDVYDFDYVLKLERGLRDNFTVPINFHIWTEEHRQGVPDRMIRHNLLDLGVSGPKKSWWYKTQLFNNKTFKGLLYYFDLDTIIWGNLDWMQQLDPNKFWACRDFRYLWRKNKYTFNSSIMKVDTTKYGHLWKKFLQSKVHWMRQYHGDQDYLNKEVPPIEKGFLSTDKIKSYRWEVKGGGIDFTTRAYPRMGQPRDHILNNCSVIVFHGTPKPHEVRDDPEIQKKW